MSTISGRFRIATAILALLAAAAGLSAIQDDRAADIILLSGRVVTMDPNRPRAEAIAVRSGRILLVGSTAHVAALKGPATRVINLQERLVVPGLVDGHLRLPELAGDSSLPLEDRIRQGIRLALSYGFTGAHDMGTSLEAVEAYKSLMASNELPFRVNAYPRVTDAGEALDRLLKAGAYEDDSLRLHVRGVNVALDGPLSSRQAALLSPYTDDGAATGSLAVAPEELQRIVEKTLEARFSLAIEATGDRANQVALDSVEQALKRVERKDHRIRIQRATVLQPADVPRFAELGILVSPQWIRCTLDMEWAEKRIGPERMATAYAWRTLLAAGARLVGGSDEGVAAFSPFQGFHAAVTRQDAKGRPRNGWYPAQRLTREEALRSYTVEPAFATFQEVRTGILAPGKQADLAVLSRDITTIAPEEILGTEAVLTMVGGDIAFVREIKK
jgi:predicted amidohydrolase YtcJ